jgi:hypothetical protein
MTRYNSNDPANRRIADLESALKRHTHDVSSLRQGTATNGQVLTWNDADLSWIPAPAGAGGVTVNGTVNEIEVTSTGSAYIVGLTDNITVTGVNTGSLTLDTTVTDPTLDPGEISWDTDYHTAVLKTTNGVEFHLGTGLYQRVHNASGVTISKGDIVYVSGSQGTDTLQVTKAIATSEATSAPTVGIACEELLHGADGYIQIYGLLQGLNTNDYTAGQPIYLSSTVAGGWQTSLPIAPNHGTFVGWVVKSAGGGAGSIFVKIHNYNELEELSDVYIPSPVNGDVLTYNTTNQRWEAAQPSGGSLLAAGNIDGGEPDTNYGGIAPFDAGGV